jgi:predicted CoA-substrate-specific enzyme activase
MMRYFAGVDSGSWTTKAVVIDGEARFLGSAIVRSAADLTGASSRAFHEAVEAAGLAANQLTAVWSTGFGRDNVAVADGSRTELDCHARGAHHYVPGPITVVDIGGQDAKIIKLDKDGRRITHKMNRKCAAGTGSFLDEMALRLGIPVDDLDALAAGYEEEIELGSFCTVFTGTELLAAIRQGRKPADLARAAYKSIVKRVIEMAVLENEVVATGGVIAYHPTVVELLGARIGRPVIVPPHPQEMGAFGAALAAREAATGAVEGASAPQRG